MIDRNATELEIETAACIAVQYETSAFATKRSRLVNPITNAVHGEITQQP